MKSGSQVSELGANLVLHMPQAALLALRLSQEIRKETTALF